MADLGRVMSDVMPDVAGRADGSAVSQTRTREAGVSEGHVSDDTRPFGAAGGRASSDGLSASRSSEQVVDLTRELAAELASLDGALLGALRDRLGGALHLRGTQLTVSGNSE